MENSNQNFVWEKNFQCWSKCSQKCFDSKHAKFTSFQLKMFHFRVSNSFFSMTFVLPQTVPGHTKHNFHKILLSIVCENVSSSCCAHIQLNTKQSALHFRGMSMVQHKIFQLLEELIHLHAFGPICCNRHCGFFQWSFCKLQCKQTVPMTYSLIGTGKATRVGARRPTGLPSSTRNLRVILRTPNATPTHSC